MPALGVLLALGGVLWYGHTQRSHGHAEGLGEAAAQHSAELAKVVAKRDTVYRKATDTLRRVLRQWDSVRVHDTIPVTIEVAGKPDTVISYVPRWQADTTVKMCVQALNACDAAIHARDSLILGYRGQINLLKKSQPSRVGRLLHDALLLGAGIGVGVVIRR